VGFEPADSKSVRPHTYALDCAATGVDDAKHEHCRYRWMKKEMLKNCDCSACAERFEFGRDVTLAGTLACFR